MSTGGWGGTPRTKSKQRSRAANLPKPDIEPSRVFGKKANRDGDRLDRLSVYDGRQIRGSIFDLPGCRVAAELADGTDLGTFASVAAAKQAILAAAAPDPQKRTAPAATDADQNEASTSKEDAEHYSARVPFASPETGRPQPTDIGGRAP